VDQSRIGELGFDSQWTEILIDGLQLDRTMNQKRINRRIDWFGSRDKPMKYWQSDESLATCEVKWKCPFAGVLSVRETFLAVVVLESKVVLRSHQAGSLFLSPSAIAILRTAPSFRLVLPIAALLPLSARPFKSMIILVSRSSSFQFVLNFLSNGNGSMQYYFFAGGFPRF
jgi:hypothetical protein